MEHQLYAQESAHRNINEISQPSFLWEMRNLLREDTSQVKQTTGWIKPSEVLAWSLVASDSIKEVLRRIDIVDGTVEKRIQTLKGAATDPAFSMSSN